MNFKSRNTQGELNAIFPTISLSLLSNSPQRVWVCVHILNTFLFFLGMMGNFCLLQGPRFVAVDFYHLKWRLLTGNKTSGQCFLRHLFVDNFFWIKFTQLLCYRRKNFRQKCQKKKRNKKKLLYLIILDLEILLSYLILSCLFFKTQKTILIYDKIGLQPVSRPLEQPFLDFESVGKSVQKVYAQKRQLKICK